MSRHHVTSLMLLAIVLAGCADNPSNGTEPRAGSGKDSVNPEPTRYYLGTPQGHGLELWGPVVEWCEQAIKNAAVEPLPPEKPWPGGPIPYFTLRLPSGTYYMYAPGNRMSQIDPHALLTNAEFSRLADLVYAIDRANGDLEAPSVKKLVNELTVTK